MDLPLVAHQMRLDAYAVRVSRALADAGITHALLKGPTTARWLYEPPRLYRDVDVLVTLADLQRAVSVLGSAGLARAEGGAVGEGASHSQVLVSREGIELDVHITLPLLPTLTVNQSTVLWSHLEPFDLDGDVVPALDTAGRGVVLALHALGSGSDTQVTDDLRRARAALGEEWTKVEALAAELGIQELVTSSVALTEGRLSESEMPLTVRLLRQGASSAYQLERLASTPWRRRPWLLLAEVLPSRSFMRHADPDVHSRRTGLLGAYARRLLRLARSLPAQARLLADERRRDQRPGGRRG